jgi:hypothetical protein
VACPEQALEFGEKLVRDLVGSTWENTWLTATSSELTW